MKTDKKPVIGFICVMLSCILVLGITIELLSSANNKTPVAGSTTDTTDTTPNNTPETPEAPEEPPVDEPAPESEPEPELEWGYDMRTNGVVCGPTFSWIGAMAYKSDKKTFDVDNVTLTLSFGKLHYHEMTESCIEGFKLSGIDIPEFEIYLADTSGNKIHTIREVKENFISEKYRVKHDDYRVFNHSEEITIPKEVFTESEGVILICIGGVNVAGKNPGYRVLDYEDLRYQLTENNEVVLSPVREDYGKFVDTYNLYIP